MHEKGFWFLREKAIKLIDLKKYESINKKTAGNLVKKKLKINIWNNTKHHKVRDHCNYRGEYRGVAHSICSLKYNVPKKFL